MSYVINVDRETKNSDCVSKLHPHDPHFDLTVHAFDCPVRGKRQKDNPPSRYWEHNAGNGFTQPEVVAKVRELRAQYSEVFARRCSRCGVSSNLPDWD